MDILVDFGKNVIRKEIDALTVLVDKLDGQFVEAVNKLYECCGRIIISGVGKSGHIAGKIAATMSSLGKPAFCVHPDDMLHGDLGMIASDDTVILISNSGESDELLMALPNLKAIGAYLIAMTTGINSRLAMQCDMVCALPHVEEACVLNMAPTSSTTVALAYGDALCVALSEKLNFTKSDFAKYHPAGALGKKLTMTVHSLMHKVEDEKICIDPMCYIKDAVLNIGANRTGAVAVVNGDGEIQGLITNGDVRRVVEKGIDIYELRVKDIMTRQPIVIQKEALAIEALTLMKDRGINASVLPVLDEQKVIGMITIYDIMKAGISE